VFEKGSVLYILRPNAEFCLNQQRHFKIRNLNAPNRIIFNVVLCHFVGYITGSFHQINDDLIGDPDNSVFRKVVGTDLSDGLIGQVQQGFFNAFHIFSAAVNQKIYVPCSPYMTVMDYRKPSDNHISNPGIVEVLAKHHQVV